MRYKIWHEDDYFDFPEGRIEMDADVVRISDPIQIHWMYNYGRFATHLGRMEDIKIEDGAITGEAMWIADKMSDETFEDLQKTGGVRLGGYFKDVVRNEAGDRVLHCSLVDVSLIMYPQVPLKPEEQRA